mmetsp:Transcript_49201/g.146958  ORF Transcript_49201/g.146958 Transcript_49201/m.146958 type:complete len:339 (-) Transcript_49201:159-1175(-)
MALPCLLTSRWRMSSRRSDGDTAASALASSVRETVPLASFGLHIAANTMPCSSSSSTPTLASSAPNCLRVIRPVESLALSICESTWRIDENPSAIHFLRKSSIVRTGAAASMALANSCTVTVPSLSVSRKSKICSWSSRDSPTTCLSRKLVKSCRVSCLAPEPTDPAKESKAACMVENLSRILWRKVISFIWVPLRGLCCSAARLLASGVAPFPSPVGLCWLCPRAALGGSSLGSRGGLVGARGRILSSTAAVLSSSGSFAAEARFSKMYSRSSAASAEFPSRLARPELLRLPGGSSCRAPSLEDRLSPASGWKRASALWEQNADGEATLLKQLSSSR